MLPPVQSNQKRRTHNLKAGHLASPPAIDTAAYRRPVSGHGFSHATKTPSGIKELSLPRNALDPSFHRPRSNPRHLLFPEVVDHCSFDFDHGIPAARLHHSNIASIAKTAG